MKEAELNYRTVALLGYQFLYQNGDPVFHCKMAEVGLFRGGDLRMGKKYSVIMANHFEYFLMDCNSLEELEDTGSVIANNVDDFCKLIKQLKEKVEGYNRDATIVKKEE